MQILENQSDAADVYDDGFLRVEHHNYFVQCGEATVKLPRAEFLIFSRLARNPKRFVTAEELWLSAWNSRKPFNVVSLHVYMYRLRRRFEPFGVRIETMVNVGYRLVLK